MLNTNRAGHTLYVFTPAMRVCWLIVVAITVVTEVVPIPLWPPIPFYTYKAFKVLLFVVMGFLAPLAFWRFNALNRGVLLATLSAMLVETLQGIIQNGHSFHWYEMAIKLFLILLGFALALVARYERRISAGFVNVQLVGEHISKD